MKYFKDPTAIVDEGAVIGEGTKIWHWTHIRESARIGRNCTIGQGVYIDRDVVIGNGCKIQNDVSIYKGVTLEDHIFVGPGVKFTNDKYPRADMWDDSMIRPIVVKHGASIGANSTIICGITIGEHAIIGAGAVVTHDVEPHTTVKGNPARKNKNDTFSLGISTE